MNILEIIDRNFFLKELYPNGLLNFYIGRIELTAFDRLTIVLHEKEKPTINVTKWGEWGKDYNIVTIELAGCAIRKVNINDWQNNNEEKCDCEVTKTTDECYLLVFSGTTWSVEIKLESLLFQRNTTYLS